MRPPLLIACNTLTPGLCLLFTAIKARHIAPLAIAAVLCPDMLETSVLLYPVLIYQVVVKYSVGNISSCEVQRPNRVVSKEAN